jgi:hypothetical protein
MPVNPDELYTLKGVKHVDGNDITEPLMEGKKWSSITGRLQHLVPDYVTLLVTNSKGTLVMKYDEDGYDL